MPQNLRRLAPAALLLAAAACTPTLAPYSFPLSYRFMGNAGEISAAADCARLAGVETADGRDDKAVAGKRYLQEGGPQYDISLNGSVEGWLRDGADKVLALASIETDPAAGHTLRLTLHSLDIQESTYRQSEFDGRLVIDAELLAGGKAVWSQREDGFAENYGRSGNPENYQETINHALDRALTKIVNDGGLRAALCR